MVLTSSPSLMRCIVTKNDCADLRLLEVERQSINAARKFEHLVEHRGAEAFDLGHAIADLPDDANVGFSGRSAVDAFDFAFEFLQNVAHGWTGLELLGECGEAAVYAAVPDIAAELDAQPAKECRRSAKLSGDVVFQILT